MLLAALVVGIAGAGQAHSPWRPNRNLVVEMAEPNNGNRHWILESPLAEELAKDERTEVVPREEARRAFEKFGSVPDTESFANLKSLAFAVYAENIVVFQTSNAWIEETPRNKRAHIELRAVVYDMATGYPVGGAKEWAEVEAHDGEAAFAEARRKATTKLARTLGRDHVPRGRIVTISPLRLLIDRGAREGFRVGDLVLFKRGNVGIGTGSVRKVRAKEAEAVIVGPILSIAPGEVVRKIYDVPFEPPYPSP